MSAHFESLLLHTCDVKHPTETEQPFGGAAVSYGGTDVGVKCRAETKTIRAFSDERAAWVESARTVLIFNPWTEVAAGDVIANLTRDGVVDTGEYRVTGVLPRYGSKAITHHVIAEIEAI